ncbi:inactive serine/threonine-protein kinase TEX14 [Bufo bufo]|uniref:inactive serine/threonine-protein kinase TEX14 n=1 Tax=Bufo bufo TaxID=8384 RepID=UPI001ABE454E|nr:inactive serine/threonine-protein kinase TEX14 [Bufo bufo]
MKVLRNTNRSILKPIKCESFSVKKVCSFGYGQFRVQDNGQAGFLLTFPLIEEKWLVREECKPTFSYASGPFMTMTNLLWGSTEVTVKGLSDLAQNKCLSDLLIAEEEKMSYLRHPLILQLLALSTSTSLERKQLVFERVTFGSFYSILHDRRSEYPILHLGTIVHILLQVIEALVFLHWRGFIHRSFSSHAIQIVAAGRAKISNFEYMIESKDGKKCDGIIHFPVPKQLYCWSSPEVVAGKAGSIKSDLYSFCAVMQECLTDALPWNGLDGEVIKDSMASGHFLAVDPTLSEPYYSIVRTGIQASPKERTTPLQDIGYLLKNDFKHFLDKVPCTQHALMIVEADMKMQRSEQEIPPDNFEEVTDLFYKRTNISSVSSTTESQSETLCDMVVQSDEMNTHLPSLEEKGQNRAGGFDQENVGSPSISLSLMSDYETVTSSDSEEGDIDCRSLGTNENWQTELQALDNRFSAIQIHHRSTLDNLLNIQTFLQDHNTVLDAEEKRKQSENVCLKENAYPDNGTDEADHALPLYKSKSYAGWSAKGPPPHYIPPDGAASSRTDLTSDTRRIQSGSVVDTVRKAFKKGEWCAGLGPFKGKTLGQDFLQLTKRSSKNSQADDIMTHQYYPSFNSAPHWPAKNLGRKMVVSSKVRADSQHLQNKKQCEPICDYEDEQRSNKTCEDCEETKLEKLFRHFAGRNCQSEENEDSSEIPGGVKPLQDYSNDTDSNLSTETSYFTPENDVSVEKTEQEACYS